MNSAPFQAPPGARLDRRPAKRRWRAIARQARAVLLAIAALAVFAAAPFVEDMVDHMVASVLR